MTARFSRPACWVGLFSLGTLQAIIGPVLFAGGVQPPGDAPSLDNVNPIATRASIFPLDRERLDRLSRGLERMDLRYNLDERLVWRKLTAPHYHSSLREGVVHPMRESVRYAVALIDTRDPEMERRGFEIISRVLEFQEVDPAKETYGIWPYYLEESLEEMLRPDWNWADFIGASLLEVRLSHQERIPEGLLARIDAALLHAARSIRKRDVGPDYTNIAIMGALVTLVVAETFGLEDLWEYARARWDRFYRYTLEQSGFTEYNSPTYTQVSLNELIRMLKYVRNAEVLEQVREVYYLAWKEIAVRFHPPTGQWSGPHSRNYQTLLPEAHRRNLLAAVTGDDSASDSRPSLNAHRRQHVCPPELRPYFLQLDEPREVVQVFERAEVVPVVGTTWLTPALALGSVNRGDLWNQRRSLVAYWGEVDSPAYLHLRFLRDGYDLAAAQFFSVQEEGRVLVAINFATDGGNTHLHFDRLEKGRLEANDLRLRLEWGGAAGQRKLTAPPALDEPVRLEDRGVHFGIRALEASFAGGRGHWQAGGDDETAWLDLVLHEGEPAVFALDEMERAVIGLALRMESGEGEPEGTAEVVPTASSMLSLVWGNLALRVPARPRPREELQRSVAGSRDGK